MTRKRLYEHEYNAIKALLEAYPIAKVAKITNRAYQSIARIGRSTDYEAYKQRSVNGNCGSVDLKQRLQRVTDELTAIIAEL